MSAASGSFDREAAVREFDSSRAGVRGLVESGVTSVPPLFVHRNPAAPPPGRAISTVSIPVVDLSLPRPAAVNAVAAACRSWGFFHVVNHGLPNDLIPRLLAAIRSFNELPAAERSPFYSRGPTGGVSYASNVDLYSSTAASWRDTVQVLFTPDASPDPSRLPPQCRNEILEWNAAADGVGRTLLALLSEGLGLEPRRLEEMSCADQRLVACHYYPRCPEPEKTMGLVSHTDPGVITVVVQDGVGGLQVQYEDSDSGEIYWVDVEPVPGALVVNVGDLMQIMSNNEYKSVKHHVVINSSEEARVSVAVFFNPGKRGDSVFYGPLPELVSQERPALYKSFTMTEFMAAFFGRQLRNNGPVDHFKL